IHDMEIRAANAASRHNHHDLTRPWGRQRSLAENELAVRTLQNHGMHGLHHSSFQFATGHSRSSRMRTDIAQPIRLKDYRPPEWLVETVSLDVSLHPTAAKVRATLALKPNPEASAAPVVLDGDGLSLVSLKVNGRTLPPDNYVATSDSLIIPQPPNAPFTLE